MKKKTRRKIFNGIAITALLLHAIDFGKNLMSKSSRSIKSGVDHQPSGNSQLMGKESMAIG